MKLLAEDTMALVIDYQEKDVYKRQILLWIWAGEQDTGARHTMQLRLSLTCIL